MDSIVQLLGSDTAKYAIYTLLHSLYIVPIIALLLYAILRSNLVEKPNRRYCAGLLALAAVVFATFATFAIYDYKAQPQAQPESPPTVATSQPDDNTAPEQAQEIDSSVDPNPHRGAADNVNAPANSQEPVTQQKSQRPDWTSWCALVWLVGTLLMLVRVAWSLSYAGQLRAQSEPITDKQINGTLQHLREKLGVARTVALATLERLNTPAVVGLVWPTILLPAVLVSAMDPQHLKAVLAHELAHIQRHDYLVNCVQLVLESLFFFNPAFWWISRQVRIEREACCDALAAAALGCPNSYARALADVAEKVRSNVGLPAVALGLSESSSSGDFLDRIKRLILPGHRPNLRLSKMAVLAVLATSLTVIAILGVGTGVAVQYVAQYLTPAQRVERMQEIIETQAPPLHIRDYDAEPVMISGAVQAYDGRSQWPSYTLVNVYSADFYMSEETWASEDGTFKIPFTYSGEIYITAALLDRYAPAVVGPLTVAPGEVLEDVKLFLGEGFVGQIRVVDSQGNPIPNAHFRGWYVGFDRAQIGVLQYPSSDENGIITIEHCGSLPIKLITEVAGYKYEERDFTLSPGVVPVWQLEESDIVRGRVVSAADGQPISGATLVLVEIITDGQTDNVWIPFNDYPEDTLPTESVVATTDQQGRFQIDVFNSQSTYELVVRAVGYGPKYPVIVTPGQDDLLIELGEPITITGTIIGDLSWMREYDWMGPQVRMLTYGYRSFPVGDTVRTCRISSSRECTIEDGVLHFRLHSLWPGEVVINTQMEGLYLRGKHFYFDVTEHSWSDVVLDLRPRQTRRVVLNFDMPDGHIDPCGVILIGFRDEQVVEPGYRYEYYDNFDVVIEDGQAVADIPIGTNLNYGVAYSDAFYPMFDGRYLSWERANSNRLVEYWFADGRNIPVTPGDEPMTFDIQTYPAGGVHGTVYNADGIPASPYIDRDYKWVVVTSVGDDPHFCIYTCPTPDSTFNVLPLPLGEPFNVKVVYFDGTEEQHGTMVLDQENPIREISITLNEMP
ncbi:MAG: carboxypeptidase regulatory-like domain-containing protein [Sedimentisphaerales bacterium]|nr:carboxypeptidase regulatory-like domain-containing protein [Sedimentisphaerales bacterium]